MSFATALAAFALITLMLVGFEIMYTYATQGFAYGFSSNREDRQRSAFGIRSRRTLQNHVESGAYIVPALVAGQATGLQGYGVGLALSLIVIGRAIYPLLYLSGITFIRVPAFVLGTFSSFYIVALALLQSW